MIRTFHHHKFAKSQLILQRSLNKFPDILRMGTFIDSKHMKL